MRDGEKKYSQNVDIDWRRKVLLRQVAEKKLGPDSRQSAMYWRLLFFHLYDVASLRRVGDSRKMGSLLAASLLSLIHGSARAVIFSE